MGQKQDARTLYTISCACGARAALDARSFGKPQVCRKCGCSFTVGWGSDPKTRKSMPVAVSLARKSADTPLRVACACGYRRAVTIAEATGNNRCPGCGRVMIVEKPPAPKTRDSQKLVKLSSVPPAPKAAPVKASASQPRQVELSVGIRTFDCSCGDRLMVLNPKEAHDIQCQACGRTTRVTIRGAAPPPGSRNPTPLPGSRNPTPLPGGRNPTPPPRPEISCECGQTVEIVKAFEANGTVCPACGQTITMEKIRAPQSKHTVIRPRFGPKEAPTPTPAWMPTLPPPKPKPGGVSSLPAAEFTVDEPAPAQHSGSAYQAVFCPCGEALSVGSEDVGKNMQCPTCLMLMAVDQLRDTTGNTVIRVRAIGKMDQDTWSLNDFS